MIDQTSRDCTGTKIEKCYVVETSNLFFLLRFFSVVGEWVNLGWPGSFLLGGLIRFGFRNLLGLDRFSRWARLLAGRLRNDFEVFELLIKLLSVSIRSVACLGPTRITSLIGYLRQSWWLNILCLILGRIFLQSVVLRLILERGWCDSGGCFECISLRFILCFLRDVGILYFGFVLSSLCS
jgi:hypothetical protein